MCISSDSCSDSSLPIHSARPGALEGGVAGVLRAPGLRPLHPQQVGPDPQGPILPALPGGQAVKNPPQAPAPPRSRGRGRARARGSSRRGQQKESEAIQAPATAGVMADLK